MCAGDLNIDLSLVLGASDVLSWKPRGYKNKQKNLDIYLL